MRPGCAGVALTLRVAVRAAPGTAQAAPPARHRPGGMNMLIPLRRGGDTLHRRFVKGGGVPRSLQASMLGL